MEVLYLLTHQPYRLHIVGDDSYILGTGVF